MSLRMWHVKDGRPITWKETICSNLGIDQWVVSTEGSWLPGKGRKGKREGEAKEKGKTGRKDVWKEKNGWIGRMEE